MNKKIICAKCGKLVDGTLYFDEYSEVERHYECPHCGFRRHWAYGNLMPDDSEYEDGGSDENE